MSKGEKSIPIQNTISTHKTANYYTTFTGISHNATQIFSYLNAKELETCLLVCKQWNQYANNETLWNDLVPEMAFGPKQWKLYFGDVGKAPPLPRVIHQILNTPCPIWPDKKVHETHLLTLIPKTVNAQPLTLQTLGELVQNPLHGPATKYKHFNIGEYKDPPAPASHWALISRDVIPSSRYQSYADQQKLLNQYPGYEVPHVLDMTVAVFMEHVQSGARLYPDKPATTYTRCQERYDTEWQLVVGGFAAGGLFVMRGYCGFDFEFSSVGVQRKL